MRKVIVFQNGTNAQLGRLSEPVRNDFGQVDVIDRNCSTFHVDLSRVDLLISLGSDWSLTDHNVIRRVKKEREVLHHARLLGIPTIGICFGAQLLALSSGATVERLERWEIGLTEVTGTESAVLSGRWMQWHYDGFSSPIGFDVLAISDVSTQAIRCGRSIGVQCHPEADFKIVQQWMTDGGRSELTSIGLDVDQILDELAVSDSELEHRFLALYDWFCNHVAGE